MIFEKDADPYDWVAGVTRLELATSCVTGRRSNQLSYTPKIEDWESLVL